MTYEIKELSNRVLCKRSDRIKPVISFGGVLHFIKPCALKTIAYTWNPKKAEPAPAFTTIGEFRCLHRYGAPMFFKPSIAEVLYQIPTQYLNTAKAFEIIDRPKNATELNEEQGALNAGFHVSTVRLYA